MQLSKRLNVQIRGARRRIPLSAGLDANLGYLAVRSERLYKGHYLAPTPLLVRFAYKQFCRLVCFSICTMGQVQQVLREITGRLLRMKLVSSFSCKAPFCQCDNEEIM